MNKFCRYVNNEIRAFAEKIIQDFSLGNIDDPVDSFWWSYFNFFVAIRNKLKEYKVWDTGEEF